MTEDIQNEPKETQEASLTERLDQTIDNFLEGEKEAPSGQPEQEEKEAKVDSSPENQESTEDSEDAGSEPDKTQSSEDDADFKGVPKGFANHPRWKEREQRFKETTQRLEEYEGKYSRLLDDPVVFKRSLEREGRTKDEIIQAMRQKGMDVSSMVDTEPQAIQAKDIENAFKKAGYDFNGLDDEGKKFYTDIFKLANAVAEDKAQKLIGEKLGPLESHINYQQTAEENRKQYNEIQEVAKNEFPNLDWKKEIEPAMHKYLDYIDKVDPKAQRFPRTVDHVYKEGTRQILIDQLKAKGSQEERDKKKAYAKPLRQSADSRHVENKTKGRNMNETVDKLMAEMGIR